MDCIRELPDPLADHTPLLDRYLTNAAELMLAMSVVHATYQVDMNLEEIRVRLAVNP